jgi:hypothetical protein
MNYRILFNDQKTKDITEEEYDVFLASVSSKMVKIGKDIISYSNVARVEPIKGENENLYPALPVIPLTPWTKAKKLRALRSMREGFLKRMADAENLTPVQSAMLRTMDKRIKNCENSAAKTFAPITSANEIYGGK